MPCACPLTYPHKTDKWETKPEAPSIVNMHHSDGMGFTVKGSKCWCLYQGKKERDWKCQTPKAWRHLLETHAQLASVPEGNSTRLVLVRIRQTRY